MKKMMNLKNANTPESKVAKAQERVLRTLDIFAKAVQEVEMANLELEIAIKECDEKTKEYTAKMAEVSATKNRATEAMAKNKNLIKRLKEFIPESGKNTPTSLGGR